MEVIPIVYLKIKKNKIRRAKLMYISQALDRPIAFHRSFISIGAGVTGALMLSQAVYWSQRTSDNSGWFYKTQADWEGETGLTRYEQEGARKKLRNLGVLEEAKRGVPCKTYYKVNFAVLDNLLIQYAENQQTRQQKTNKQCSGKPADSAWENQQSITENTHRLPETTTDIIGASAESRADDNSESTKPKKKRSNKVVIPEDFKPTAQHYELANKNGVDLNHEFEQFKDHHIAKQSKFADWHAALRTWIRNSAKFAKGKPQQKKSGYINQDYSQVNYREGVDDDGRF
ncbi:hypothetical protein PVP_XSN000042 [Vibrio phage PVP-XSN]|uniref:Replication protein n=1 Tax=Vibrio phage PVP-XSN TaxID=3056214 RepID=A0AAX3Y3Y0_9CAUD|nr:hypothetical protein PVP_XSN000007 [Vibrio phage PVP-XSN]